MNDNVEVISVDEATLRLYAFIRDCDGDTVAALYEHVFGGLKATYEDGKIKVVKED